MIAPARDNEPIALAPESAVARGQATSDDAVGGVPAGAGHDGQAVPRRRTERSGQKLGDAGGLGRRRADDDPGRGRSVNAPRSGACASGYGITVA